MWSVEYFYFFADNLFAQHQINMLPAPVQVEKGNGFFQISEETVISVENEEQESLAADFADLFTVPAGFTPSVEIGAANAAVSLITDRDLKKRHIGWKCQKTVYGCMRPRAVASFMLSKR